MKSRCIQLLVLTLSALCAEPRLGFAQAATADSLTANDVVRLALQNNPVVERLIREAQASEARVGLSRNPTLPVVEGSASYTRLDPIISLAIGPGQKLNTYPNDNFDVHVGMRHNLYDFGRNRETVRLSESRAVTSDHAVNIARSMIAFQAIRAFYSALFLQRSLKVQDQQIAALDEHIDVAQRRVQAGTATSFDVLTTQVRVAGAQSQRADLQNALDKQITTLRELLGLPVSAAVRLKGEFGERSVSTNEDSLAQTAFGQRPEMQVARDAVRTAEMQKRVAELGDMPSVNVGILYGMKNGYLPSLNVWKGNWVASGGLSVPIFNGYRKHYQMDEAEAAQRSADEQIKALERQIRSDISRAVADITTAQSKLAITDLRIRQAEDAVTLARARYTNGTVTNTDVLDAETSLAEARLGYVQALYNLTLSQYALKQAVGLSVWTGTAP